MKVTEYLGRGVERGVAILIQQDIKFNKLDTSEFDEKLRTGAKHLL